MSYSTCHNTECGNYDGLYGDNCKVLHSRGIKLCSSFTPHPSAPVGGCTIGDQTMSTDERCGVAESYESRMKNSCLNCLTGTSVDWGRCRDIMCKFGRANLKHEGDQTMRRPATIDKTLWKRLNKVAAEKDATVESLLDHILIKYLYGEDDAEAKSSTQEEIHAG